MIIFIGLYCRKLLGRFNYFTVLGFPSALGAAVSSLVLAERAVYHYAHGLSTIVSIASWPAVFAIFQRKKQPHHANIFSFYCFLFFFTVIPCVTFTWWFLYFKIFTQFSFGIDDCIHVIEYDFNAWFTSKSNQSILLACPTAKTKIQLSWILRSQPHNG